MGKYHKQDEIYKLVMDCRTSGLSDFQWCKANGVNPSSLYRWVEKLRSKGCDIPDKVKGSAIKNLPQEVVKLEVSTTGSQHSMQEKRNTPISPNFASISVPVIEITVGELTTRFTNDVNPELLKVTLLCLSNLGGAYVG
ncbi:MAG TPA: IS66 family insertion sequence hypothetical protein [Lachnospiraceae bacterium]|nr:IS66 family insertion sequence hypothetical protein [Lachnospiraceae bacterium]